jgi:hypothetical protein
LLDILNFFFYIPLFDLDLSLAGMNLIFCRDFLVIAPIRGPIKKYGDLSIFLQPYALMGYIHLPILDPLWPEASIAPKDSLEFNPEINNPGGMMKLLKTLVDAAN